MLGTAETVAAVDAALDLLEPGTPVVIDPVMVAESGAVLLDDDARARARRAAAAARDRDHAEPARGARARRRRTAPEDAEALARALHALGPATWSWSPAGTARRRPTCSSTARRSHLIPGERHPDGAAHGSGCTHSSALAAHLALGRSPLEAARAARAIAAAAVRDGLRGLGRGAGPGRRPGPDREARRACLSTPGPLGYSRPTMKFLRMRPGFGEQLIAEGDVEVAEEEQALIEEFRRQLDDGHVGGGADARARTAGARRRWCGRSTTSRATPTGSSSSRARRAARRAVIVALSATAIVVLALLWEVSMPWFERRLEARRARRERRARGRSGAAYDPGRERRAEQRARELLKSCVNEEEWAMYRDLGFLRVWGGQSEPDGPSGPARRRLRLPRSTRTSRSSPTCRRPAGC